MAPLFVLLGLASLLLFLMLLALLRLSRASLRGAPFDRRRLLDAESMGCFHALEQALGPGYRLCPAVAAAAMLQPLHGLRRRQRRLAEQALAANSADLLLCAEVDLYPLVMIRLRAQRQRRQQARASAWLQRACSAAGLPVIELSVSEWPARDQLVALIDEAVGMSDVRIQVASEPSRLEDEATLLSELSRAMRDDDSGTHGESDSGLRTRR